MGKIKLFSNSDLCLGTVGDVNGMVIYNNDESFVDFLYGIYTENKSDIDNRDIELSLYNYTETGESKFNVDKFDKVLVNVTDSTYPRLILLLQYIRDLCENRHRLLMSASSEGIRYKTVDDYVKGYSGEDKAYLPVRVFVINNFIEAFNFLEAENKDLVNTYIRTILNLSRAANIHIIATGYITNSNLPTYITQELSLKVNIEDSSIKAKGMSNKDFIEITPQ